MNLEELYQLKLTLDDTSETHLSSHASLFEFAQAFNKYGEDLAITHQSEPSSEKSAHDRIQMLCSCIEYAWKVSQNNKETFPKISAQAIRGYLDNILTQSEYVAPYSIPPQLIGKLFRAIHGPHFTELSTQTYLTRDMFLKLAHLLFHRCNRDYSPLFLLSISNLLLLCGTVHEQHPVLLAEDIKLWMEKFQQEIERTSKKLSKKDNKGQFFFNQAKKLGFNSIKKLICEQAEEEPLVKKSPLNESQKTINEEALLSPVPLATQALFFQPATNTSISKRKRSHTEAFTETLEESPSCSDTYAYEPYYLTCVLDRSLQKINDQVLIKPAQTFNSYQEIIAKNKALIEVLISCKEEVHEHNYIILPIRIINHWTGLRISYNQHNAVFHVVCFEFNKNYLHQECLTRNIKKVFEKEQHAHPLTITWHKDRFNSTISPVDSGYYLVESIRESITKSYLKTPKEKMRKVHYAYWEKYKKEQKEASTTPESAGTPNFSGI
jgi:hypothetical protein